MPRFLDLPAAILLHVVLAMVACAVVGSALLLVGISVIAAGFGMMRPSRRFGAAGR